MVDITDPVETILALLKDPSTGLGSAGYEVTDDNSDAVSILVTYKLSNEELKVLFGGSQDYDVIITVEKDEVKDEWIGLSTKQWTVSVILTVYIIDKWTTVGSDQKYLTAPLVRSKVENTLRKFVKDHTSSPGGSIITWRVKSIKNEEDKGIRPIVSKAIVTTEAWTYYNTPELNPSGTEEQIINGGFENDLNDWEQEQDDPCNILDDVTIDTSAPYEGEKAARIPANDLTKLRFNFGLYFNVDHIYCWWLWARSYGSSAVMSVDIIYTDSSITSWTEALTSTYKKVDLKAHVTAGKQVFAFRFWSSDASSLLVDGNTCQLN